MTSHGEVVQVGDGAQDVNQLTRNLSSRQERNRITEFSLSLPKRVSLLVSLFDRAGTSNINELDSIRELTSERHDIPIQVIADQLTALTKTFVFAARVRRA